VARIRALLRRAQPTTAAGRIELGDLLVDTLAHEVLVQGRKLSLTRREFELLAFLAAQPERVHSREELLRKVWGYDYVGETRTVDVHVRRLRAKLGEQNRLIETVTGVGYRFASPARAEKR
jgi:DNA-binding response OmpR family regulator